MDLEPLGRFPFYEAARGPDVALAIATGEQRLYANLLLTIGVVSPD
jgi:L-fucose mutarotase